MSAVVKELMLIESQPGCGVNMDALKKVFLHFEQNKYLLRMTITHQTKTALAARLASGLTTRQIGEQKQRRALEWLYRWGWSWPTLLEQIGGAQGNRLTARLQKNKLITTMVPDAAGTPGVPKKIALLSEHGLHETERFQDKLLRYECDPYRVRQPHLRHDALAQRITAAQMGRPGFTFLTERELASRSQKAVKQPDVLWKLNGKKYAVEIELSAKWDRHLDQFILATIRSLLPAEGAPARFDYVLLYTDSPAIRDRYQYSFEPGQTFNKWERSGTLNTDKWKVVRQLLVPEEIRGRVICQLFE